MPLKNPLPTMLFGAACLTAMPLAVQAADAPATAPPAAAAAASSPPSPAAVVNMINNCYACHGTDGRSPGAIPSLTGKSAEQALLQLKEFKSGQLSSTVMTRHAKGYTDEELAAIANYIGSNLK